MQTLQPQKAVADLKRVMALEPGNTTVKAQLETTQKLVRRIEFEKVRPRRPGRVCRQWVGDANGVGAGDQGWGGQEPRGQVFGDHRRGFVVASQLDVSDIDKYAIDPAGGCDMDKTYEGPKLTLEDGKYKITKEFVKGMIQWFKDGKALPKRYVWEIVLGAYSQFIQEDSLVYLNIEDGMTCDVIGDVHGKCLVSVYRSMLMIEQANTMV